jgi:hypothetical protein
MRTLKLGSAAIVATLLAACSSGDDPPPAPPPFSATGATGFWGGTTSSNRSIDGVVMDNGQYWLVYSGVGLPNSIAGFLQGNGIESGSNFDSKDTVDFNLEGPSRLTATLAATYVTRTSFNATITYPGTTGTGTLTTRYDADYERPASIAAIVGTYVGQGGAGAPTVTLTVNAGGGMNGSSSGGCTFTGTLVPRTKGNVYDSALTFGGAPCDLPFATLRGVATVDTATRVMVILGLDTGRTSGFLFLGQRPAAADSGPTVKAEGAFGRFTATASGGGLMTFSQ